MSNINKILIAVVSCVFMICVASVSIVSIVTSNEKETTTTTDAPPSQYAPSDESTTDSLAVSGQTQSTSQSTTVKPQTDSTTTTTAPSEASPSTSASDVTGNLAADILGKWNDSAGLIAFEFLEGGRVNMTYFDLAGFGVPIDGTSPGTYTLEGDVLTIKFSIYTATIKKTYRVSVSQNELSMYDLEEHETSTYMRAS